MCIFQYSTILTMDLGVFVCRWYIMNNKIDKAIEMLKKFAKVNGKEVKQEVFDEFEKSCKAMIERDQSYNQYTVLDLFKLPRLARITVVLIVYW